MARRDESIFDQFQRSFDEVFDDLLSRWGCRAAGQFEHADVIDNPDRYEIRLHAAGLDPSTVEVHTQGQRVTVSAPSASGERLETSFSFPQPIDAEAATARWSGDTLTIVLPKHKLRRVVLK
jgi:HSP20 family molecular chaperone IbpA